MHRTSFHSPVPWRVTALMSAGERLARDVAAAQARMAPERRLRGVLASQARQEAFHAQVFGAATLALGAPRGAADADWGLAPLRARIEQDLARGDLPATLVGLQIMVESLGEDVLERMDARLERTGGVARRLRALIVGQERAHHEFGARTLERMVSSGAADRRALAAAGHEYWNLLQHVIADCAGMLHDYGVPAERFCSSVAARVPPWLLPGEAR